MVSHRAFVRNHLATLKFSRNNFTKQTSATKVMFLKSLLP